MRNYSKFETDKFKVDVKGKLKRVIPLGQKRCHTTFKIFMAKLIML